MNPYTVFLMLLKFLSYPFVPVILLMELSATNFLPYILRESVCKVEDNRLVLWAIRFKKT